MSNPTHASLARELILAYRMGGNEVPTPVGLAAALEALADQVAPESQPTDSEEWLGQSAWLQAEHNVRFKILAIAAQLRGDTTQPQPQPHP